MRRQRVLVAVAALLVVSAAEAAPQTGPYIQIGVGTALAPPLAVHARSGHDQGGPADVGTALAPPLAVHGSDDDWSTKCNP